MENLKFEGTKSTPFVFFDAQRGTLEIKGRSYPENAAKFYAPIFQWVSSYLQSPDTHVVQMTLEIVYLNTSSSKALLDLLDMLDQAAKSGRKVVINWRYHEEDETALECGEEFREDLEAVIFNLVKMTGD
jgi:hypothetical protein